MFCSLSVFLTLLAILNVKAQRKRKNKTGEGLFILSLELYNLICIIPVKNNTITNLHLFAGDKDRFSFPPEMPTVHAEFTYFYYPGDFVFPRKYIAP